jgi:hypothetical protein
MTHCFADTRTVHAVRHLTDRVAGSMPGLAAVPSSPLAS